MGKSAACADTTDVNGLGILTCASAKAAPQDRLSVTGCTRKVRCRMHGGAPGSGAPFGRRNGNYRHGYFTAEAKEQRLQLRLLIRGD
jgi:hypothetical protein